MQQTLQIFEYERDVAMRSVNIGGEPWFAANDVCAALKYKNPRSAIAQHVDKEDVVKHDTPTASGNQRVTYINESGMYALIFGSNLQSAKRFKRWVTKEVLPLIRKTGGYDSGRSGAPAFVRRFNDNWDRVDVGYFSVISELFIRFYGRLEQVGYALPDKAKDGREIRPDISVGIHFSKWLKLNHPEVIRERKKYSHKLPEGLEVEANQYPMERLPIFIKFVDEVWLRNNAESYLSERDTKALDYLPKLLPAPKQ